MNRVLSELSKFVNRNLIFISVMFIFVFFAICYLALDTLNVYDAAGQMVAIDRARTFWPDWQGWSSRELLGWSQGVAYPPALIWILAGLSFVIGTSVAAKLLVFLAIVALPISIWWYLQQLSLSKKTIQISLLVVTIVLFVTPEFMASNISSLFFLGMISSFLPLPLLFIYFGLLEKIVQKQNLKNIIFAALLLGFLMWSHVVIAIVACVYLAVVALICLLKRNYKKFAYLSITGAAGLIFGFPFIWGMYVFVKNQISSSVGMRPLFWLNALVLFIAAFCLWYLLRKKNETSLVPVTVAVLIAAIVVADCVLVRLFGTSFILDWLHAYRLQIFCYILTAVAVVQVLSLRFEKFISSQENLIGYIGALLLLVIAAMSNPLFFNYADVQVDNKTDVNGRFLEIFRRSESYPSPYTFQTKLLNHDPDSSWAYGLFIESSPNSSFVKSLAKSFRPSAYQDEIDKTEIEDTIISKSSIPFVLDLFAINSIISLDDNSKNAIGTWRRDVEVKYFHQEALDTKELVAINDFQLKPIKHDWDKAVKSWWKQDGQINSLLYDSSKGEIPTEDNSKATVELLKWSDREIIINIKSVYPNLATVLIKTTYSTRWKASNVFNDDLQVWKVSPYLMMIHSEGIVSLRYE